MNMVRDKEWLERTPEKIEKDYINNDVILFKLPTESYLFGKLSMTSDKQKCITKYTDFALIDGETYGILTSFCDYYFGRTENRVVNSSGYTNNIYDDYRCVSIRPMVKFSKIAKDAKICSNDVNEGIFDSRLKKDYFEVSYGEYPQFKVSEEERKKYYKLLTDDKLIITDKSYIYSVGEDAKSYREYYYEGRKFIIVEIDGKIEFIEVEPVIWQVDLKNDIALSKYALFSGVSYNESNNYLNKVFAKDLIPSNYPLKEDMEVIENPEYINNINNKIADYYNLMISRINVKIENEDDKHKKAILINTLTIIGSIIVSLLTFPSLGLIRALLILFMFIIFSVFIEKIVFDVSTEYPIEYEDYKRDLEKYKDLANYFDRKLSNTKTIDISTSKKESEKVYEDKIAQMLKNSEAKCAFLPIEDRVIYLKKIDEYNKDNQRINEEEVKYLHSSSIDLNNLYKERNQLIQKAYLLDLKISETINMKKEIQEVNRDSIELSSILSSNIKECEVALSLKK